MAHGVATLQQTGSLYFTSHRTTDYAVVVFFLYYEYIHIFSNSAQCLKFKKILSFNWQFKTNVFQETHSFKIP